jgi:transposase
MERRLRREEVMTIEVLHERGLSNRAIARQLGVHENAVRYRLSRSEARARDRRADKVSSVAPFAEAIGEWVRCVAAGRGANGLALYEWLVAEHGFPGSYQAVQRVVRAQYPAPRIRVRRIETPPGAQAQADWGEFRGVVIAEAPSDLFAFHLMLSHSRHEVIVWSEGTDELAWLSVHNAALRRLGGVPGVIRVDNTKTAIATGAGPWGVVNERYATYARALRFHVDAARPYTPQDKGKVERRILAHKVGFDPRRRAWRDLAELQGDGRGGAEERREADLPCDRHERVGELRAEQRLLTPLPLFLPEPFDLVAQRRVGREATVAFEGRTYSVPFRFVDQVVELRGCAATVQVWAGGGIVAEHARATRARIVLDPSHYEGESTARVASGAAEARDRRLAEISDGAGAATDRLLCQLAEVAR